MFYFRSRHGLTCRWPPRQACCGWRFWCRASPSAHQTSRRSPPAPARSLRSPQPASQRPCAFRGLICRPPRQLAAAATNSVPSAPLVHGVPRRVTMKARSPVGPASSVACNCGSSGSSTRMPVFSLSIEITVKRRAAGETLAEIAKSYAVDLSMISRLS
jgi:hypothetical protein